MAAKNDPPSEKSAEPIAKSTLLLDQKTTSNNGSFSVSSIIQHNDKWNKKVSELNSCLKTI